MLYIQIILNYIFLQLELMYTFIYFLADAKRIISGGGMYLNFEKMNSPLSLIIPERHVLSNGISLIRIGNTKFSVHNYNIP